MISIKPVSMLQDLTFF